jgi:general secretion pathway protein H
MPDRGVTLRGLSTCVTMPCATAHRRQRGFSMLELLVALMVVVLVTTLVNFTVSSGGQDVQLRAQVYELAEVASYALDEAQTTGVDYGLLLEEEPQSGETIYSFNWLEHRIDGWAQPLSGKEVFAKQRLPAGVTLDLELEDSPLLQDSPDDDADRKERKHGDDPEVDNALHPQVVFYSSGETTVGAINVRQAKGGDLLWRVEWDLLGRFKVLPRGEEVEESDQQDEDR